MTPYISQAQKNTAPTYTAECTTGLPWYARMKASAMRKHTAPPVPRHAPSAVLCAKGSR